MISCAKSQRAEIIARNVHGGGTAVAAMGDSSVGDAGKTKTAGQAGRDALVPDDKGEKFRRGETA